MSNTLYLERELGWKGLLIEPTPAIFDRMIAKNRKTVGLNACLSPNKTAMELPFRYFIYFINYSFDLCYFINFSPLRIAHCDCFLFRNITTRLF